MEDCRKFYENELNSSTDASVIEHYKDYTEKLIRFLEDNYPDQQAFNSGVFIKNFTRLDTYINKHDELLVFEQLKERFHVQKGDSFLLHMAKPAKWILLKSGWIAARFANLFRKTKHPLHYWKHCLREQELASYVYYYKFHSYFLPYFQEFLQKRFELVRALNKLDNNYEKLLLGGIHSSDDDNSGIKECQKIHRKINTLINTRIKALEKNLKIEFDEQRVLAGTIELPYSHYKSSRVFRKTNRLLKKYQKFLQNHHLAVQAVCSYWIFEAGTRTSVIDIDNKVKHAINLFEERVDTLLLPELHTIVACLNNAITFIKDYKPNAGKLSYLSEQVSLMKSTIKEMLDRTARGDLMESYNSLYPGMLESLKNIPETSRFSSKVFKARLTKRKLRLKSVEGRKILEGILSNTIQDIISDEGIALQQKILKLTGDLEEILQVVEVSYDYYGPKQNSFPDNDRQELSESLKRTFKKTEEFKKDLLELVNTTNKLFNDLNDQFKQEIKASLEPDELINTDRKRRIKSFWRLSRQKSEESLQFLRKSTINGFKWGIQSYSSFKNRYLNLRSILGISAQKEALSSEIANYLSETEKAIAQLPIMYQRLFMIKPLVDERFYIKRASAISELETTYQNWKDQKFAPTCIIGEQGSGATTLLNFFEKNIDSKIKLVRINLTEKCLTSTDFNDLLNKFFPDVKFATIDDLLAKIKTSEKQSVIILENIQHLFLRRIKGFENLYRLFHLISQSNSRVFWICTCLQYSWKYLENTHQISDYFAHVVELDNLSQDLLSEAILKRHRPSGFKMIFIPPDDYKKSPYLLWTKKSDSQENLRKEFFIALKEYTKGNLSFAFLLWLRSVVKIEDNTLFFKFQKLNLGFLRSMDVKNISSLYSILLHSGLTCDEHAEIFGTSHNESFIQLMVMTDDGILILKENRYTINPILYRHIVSHLESVNFIH